MLVRCFYCKMDSNAGSLSDGNPKNKIVYLIQVLTLLLIILFCLINLTGNFSPGNERLWVGLLGSCVGYLLPNPRLKRS